MDWIESELKKLAKRETADDETIRKLKDCYAKDRHSPPNSVQRLGRSDADGQSISIDWSTADIRDFRGQRRRIASVHAV